MNATLPLHEALLDAADTLMDLAERELADAFACGETDRAARWGELACHVAAGVRAVRPLIHSVGAS